MASVESYVIWRSLHRVPSLRLPPLSINHKLKDYPSVHRKYAHKCGSPNPYFLLVIFIAFIPFIAKLIPATNNRRSNKNKANATSKAQNNTEFREMYHLLISARVQHPSITNAAYPLTYHHLFRTC